MSKCELLASNGLPVTLFAPPTTQPLLPTAMSSASFPEWESDVAAALKTGFPGNLNSPCWMIVGACAGYDGNTSRAFWMPTLSMICARAAALCQLSVSIQENHFQQRILSSCVHGSGT